MFYFIFKNAIGKRINKLVVMWNVKYLENNVRTSNFAIQYIGLHLSSLAVEETNPPLYFNMFNFYFHFCITFSAWIPPTWDDEALKLYSLEYGTLIIKYAPRVFRCLTRKKKYIYIQVLELLFYRIPTLKLYQFSNQLYVSENSWWLLYRQNRTMCLKMEVQ